MARARYDQAPRPNVVVTQTANGTEFFPLAGVENSDGSTASLMVAGGGDSVSSAFVVNQFSIVGGASAVQISAISPVSTRFSVMVQNIGGYPVWVGSSGVTNATGWLITSGNSQSFPLGPNAALYVYNSTGGSTVSVMELS